MLLADNHFTPILGIDIHFNSLPPWNPLHPFIGFVIDPADYIPFIGGTVHINGIKRGVSDTSGIVIPMIHIPLFTGPFVMTAIIGHESMNFFSSATVLADGTRLSPKGHMVMTCNDIGIPLSINPGKVKVGKKMIPFAPTLFAPTSFSLPIPTGPPVMVAGPYPPDWGGALMGLVMNFGFGALMKGMRGLVKKFNHLLKGNGPNGLSRALCKMGFEPINLVNGAVVYDGTDFDLTGPIALSWNRSWYSDSEYSGWLGHGVHNNYDRTITQYPEENAIVLRMDDGRLVPLPFNELEEGYYVREEKITVTRVKNGYTVFEQGSYLTYTFDLFNGYNEYRLTKITNPVGFSISLQINGNRLLGIIDSAGRQIVVDSNASGRITAMTLHSNKWKETLVKYEYDTEGNLIAIKDALDIATVIEYENHLMVKKTDRNKQAFYWKYDGKKTGARCIHTWGDGGWQNGRIQYFPEEGYNLVTDANDAVTTYYYTPDQLVTQIKDPLGNSYFTEYTDFMEVYRVIDEEGFMTGYTYDDFGNQTSIVYPDGTTTMLLYDKENRLSTVVDPEGNQTLYIYKKDNKYLLNSVLEPDNSITTFEYNEIGLVKEVAKEGRKTTLDYDDDYNLTTLTDDKGQQSQWKYDHKGQVQTVKVPNRDQQRFSYDKLGRVVKIEAADYNVTQLKYNAYEEVIEAKDLQHHVKFKYTPLGSLAQREEKGVKVNFQYDAMEQLLNITNEHNERYEFTRNQRGDILQEEGFDGMLRKYDRDNAGKVIKVQRPSGNWTEYEYDALGRITRTEHQDGSWETFSYNKNGMLVEARNEQVCIQLLRDAMGRVVKETQSHGVLGDKGFEIISQYDRKGNRTMLKSSLGAQVDNTYDQQGQLEQIQAQSEALLAQEKEAWKARITRNALGQEIERVVTGGITAKTEYDQAGRPISLKVRSGNKETYNREYTWNPNHQLTQTLNKITNGRVGYTYDAFGSLASAYYEDGTYDYKLPDEVGNLYKTESKKDRVYGRGGKLLQDPDWYYGYDSEGNLQLKSKHSLSDSKDNKEADKRTWHAGDWWYEWNANGMLRSVKRPDGLLVEFEYDALGRRTAKVFKDKITRFVWDGNVLLHEWQYDLVDRPQQIVNDIGEILLDREEPVENLITWIYEEGSFVPSGKIINDEKFSIIADYIGRPVQCFTENGKVVWETDYDIYGGLRNLKGDKCFVPFRQLGQYEDEESELYYNRFRYYSAETGTYLSQDPTKLKGGNAFYSYVLDSNFWIDIFGLTGTYAFTDGTTFYIGKGDHGRMLASIRQRVGTGNAIRSQHVDFGNSDMGLMVEAELMDRHNAVGDPTFANAINSPGKKKLAAASPAVRATVITNADAFETSYKAAHGGICL